VATGTGAGNNTADITGGRGGNGWSAAATFEGEFSNVTRSYAGKGMARYAW
jgi:hypothetical protein